MRTERKAKVSITLERDLLEAIDRRAAGNGTRSKVIEEWLWLAAREQARRDLDAATAAYYEGRTRAQRDDDAVVAEFSTRTAGERDVDRKKPARRRRA